LTGREAFDPQNLVWGIWNLKASCLGKPFESVIRC
jgi:hypothetical protein